MKKKYCNFLRVFVYLIVFILLGVCYSKYMSFINTHNIFIQLLILFLMYITLAETIRAGRMQVEETLRIEIVKKFSAIESLIYELKFNRDWVNQFIKDSVDGGHLKPNATIVLTPPYLEAHKRLFGVGLGNLKLERDLIQLYSSLHACEVLVNLILRLRAYEGITHLDQVPDYNQKLYDFCLKIAKDFDEPISFLERINEIQEKNIH